MVSDGMKRISDSRGSPHDPQGTRNKLIMTNIYADKMRFGNKRNKCDVVGFVNGNHVNKDIEDSSNINSTSSEIDYEGRIGMTNSRDNHNKDVGDDIIDYNDYQGGNNSVNCSDNGNTNISKNKSKNKNDVLNLNSLASYLIAICLDKTWMLDDFLRLN
ncbi:Hypothetical predicted protein [Octopus vulgaris]|uniref:Uncharacterized protein n=1 Tax=Octopus vulgaris TaxID=6645 RepID=A0AA36FMC9_OCTVU|nr:Hypothetical predicted protein [Octopus vulgaris]